MESIMVWIKENIVGLPLAAGAMAVISLLWLYIRLRMFGSRRSSKNWGKTLELFGDTSLLKLGARRINPDTITTEGDAASVYYQQFYGYVYETVGNVRFCYRRSYVVEVYAYYQWETERRLGENLMNHFVSHPLPNTGLEEKSDTNGKPYWVKVPVPDELVPELTCKLPL